MVCVVSAAPALADPEMEPAPVPADAVASSGDGVPVTASADGAPAPPSDDGRVASSAPASTKTPDGWTLEVSAKDESQLPIAPLTTALASRDYIVGGLFNATLTPPNDTEDARGVLEVGYQVGCGIDMSTSNGVSVTGSAGITPALGFAGVGTIPAVSAPISGGVTVGLKPGIINIVPVDKKEFKGAKPWVMITGFHIKIDGCVGQSFIRSYATLTRSTDLSDAILSYYGVTKTV